MSAITFFKDEFAKKKVELDMSLEELVEEIRSAHAPLKEMLPWLKLSLYGLKKAAGGSLRHDDNLIAMTGNEIDYDGERVPMEDAASLLRDAGLECLLYETPSSTLSKPRWRVLYFFSRSVTIAAEERTAEKMKALRKKYVDFVDEIIGRIAAPESYKLSQAFYYGMVDGTAPRKMILVPGVRADLLMDGRDSYNSNSDSNPFTEYADLTLADVDERLAAMRHRAEGDAGVHATQLAATASLLNAGTAEEEVISRVLDATRRAAGPNSGWDWHRERRTIQGMCRSWARRLSIEEQQFREGVVGSSSNGTVVQIDQAREQMRDWTADLVRSRGKHKDVKPLHKNLVLFLCNHPSWQGVLGYDEFAHKLVVRKPPPWGGSGGRDWGDHDDLRALNWFHCNRVEASLNGVAAAVIDVSTNLRRFHPVREWLDALAWDGTPRLAQWARDFLGAPDNRYVRAVGQNALVAAVARLRSPGCKMDTILILEGKQGTLKSTAVRKLFEPWFTDEMADFGSKDAAMQMRGAWCVEVSELDAMSRADISKVKSFVTRQVDRFRPPYGKHVVESPRQCIFIGTVNTREYLRDETGNRRFLPIRTTRIDLPGLEAAKEQLWAEAAHMHREGHQHWISDQELLRDAEDEQSQRFVTDDWETTVGAYLSGCGDRTSVGEILREALQIPVEDHSQQQQNRISRILKHLGWERYLSSVDGRRVWQYKNSTTWGDEGAGRTTPDGLGRRFLAYGESVLRCIVRGEFR